MKPALVEISLDQISELTPNMRKALRECEMIWINPQKTYWMTLQGMVCRGLIDLPRSRTGNYYLTRLGMAYKKSIVKEL